MAPQSNPQPDSLASRFPTAYTILFVLIIVVAGYFAIFR